MPLKKLLVYTPNIRIQANTRRLLTSYLVHRFARTENESWGRFFYINKRALIIAIILMVWVNDALIIYPLQITIFKIFLAIFELRLFLMLAIKLIRSVSSYTIGNKTNFFEDLIEGSSLFDPPPTKMLDSVFLVLKKWSLFLCPGSFSNYCKSFILLL